MNEPNSRQNMSRKQISSKCERTSLSSFVELCEKTQSFSSFVKYCEKKIKKIIQMISLVVHTLPILRERFFLPSNGVVLLNMREKAYQSKRRIHISKSIEIIIRA